MDFIMTLFTIFISIILPVGAGILLSVKKKGYLKPVLLGAATFTVVQFLTRVQALNLLGMTAWYNMFAMSQPVLFALFLGATAALFEEGGRWLTMTLFMKKKHRVSDGIAFGVGHGGIEAILFVGIGMTVGLLSGNPAPSSDAFITGIERLMTMVIHISWSVMVLKSVVLKKPSWLILAFVLHTAVDMGAVLLGQAGIAPLWIEGFVFVFAAAMLIYTIAEFRKYKGGQIQ